MKKYTTTLGAALGGLLIASSAQAANILIDSGFDAAGLTSTTGEMIMSDIDQGWVSRVGNTGFDYDATNNNAVSDASTNDYAFSQVVSVGAVTGDTITFAVEWTAAALATNAAQRDLLYSVVGWTTTSGDLTGMVAGDGWSQTDAGGAHKLWTRGDAPGFTSYDLLADSSSTGDTVATKDTITGTAGTINNFSLDIDISGYSSSVTDVGQLNWIGIYFSQADNQGIGGGLVDNVTLSVSAVPEPSTTALLGLGGLALILRRRK